MVDINTVRSGSARSGLLTGRKSLQVFGWLLLLTGAKLVTPSVGGEGTPAVRSAEYRDYALHHGGDAQAGERLFRENEKLACANCHRITGAEKSGPNLDGIADKYSRQELIRHVLEPSATVKPGYEQVVIVTQEGRTLTGRINRATKLMVRLIDADGRNIDVQLSDIDEMNDAATSMMPANLESLISQKEFGDLIAYLETLHAGPKMGLVGPAETIEVPRLNIPATFRPIHPPELSFDNPVWCGAIPGLAGQLAVLEHQEARVWRLETDANRPRKDLFLDLGGEVKYGNNWGLMCLAFHPQFAENRRYFLKHEVEEGGRVVTTVVERRAAEDLLHDSGTPSRRLLAVEQPAFNHNGGCLAFGPDGMLYVAFGDGGPQRDPNGYSQDPRVLHGSMLRIDVDRQEGDRPYAVPADNPFVEAHQRDPSVRPETWAIGFREPWRFSFDPQSGDLWLGDVGQDKFEEICLVRRGENHGWNVFEAYEPFSAEYRQAGAQYVQPLFAYPHSLGVSVTGGHVYRGSRARSFNGVYVFGDYESRRVWGLKRREAKSVAIRELGEAPEHIASFGIDGGGEIYVVGYEGTIFYVDLSGTMFK